MTGYGTADYELIVADKVEDGVESRVYRVMNTEYGIVEYEDYLLPRIIDTMLEMQARLDAVKVKFAEPKAPTFTVVGDPSDGANTAH